MQTMPQQSSLRFFLHHPPNKPSNRRTKSRLRQRHSLGRSSRGRNRRSIPRRHRSHESPAACDPKDLGRELYPQASHAQSQRKWSNHALAVPRRYVAEKEQSPRTARLERRWATPYSIYLSFEWKHQCAPQRLGPYQPIRHVRILQTHSRHQPEQEPATT